MQSQRILTRYKQKLLIFLSALFIVILLQPNLTVYADAYSDIANYVIVNSTNSSTGGGTDTISRGVSRYNTGYMCYLLTKDGAGIPGTAAYAFKSPGYSGVVGETPTVWVANSRKGGYSVNGWNPSTAPWNCTPWEKDGVPSNEPTIKNWFLQSVDGVDNSLDFVEQYWGEEAAHRFGNDDYILVIETLMNFQYSVKSKADNIDLEAYATTLYNKVFPTSKALINYIDVNARTLSDFYYNAPQEDKWGIIQSFKQQIIDSIEQQLIDGGYLVDGEGRSFVGDPVIGTVPELIRYRQALGMTSDPFYSYTRASACMNEKILIDEAGFIACPIQATRTSPLTDEQVFQYGVAMMIIHCKDPAQTTCDEPLIPSPHDPPKESDGKITIVKSYREKINGEEKHVATTSRSNLGTQIIIENEQTYQVVGWKITNTTNTGISSIDWNPPGSVQGNNGSGTTPTSVTIEPTYTCLYVLLEKVEEEPPEEEPWNYNLTQSQITRRVWFSNPDHNKLGNMNNPEWIYEHKFNWASPATPYCEGHEMKGPCSGHKQDCDCNNLQYSLF